MIVIKLSKRLKNSLKSQKHTIYSFSKVATSHTLILKTARLSKMLAPKIIKVGNNKIVSRDKADKTIDKLAKFKNIKNC